MMSAYGLYMIVPFIVTVQTINAHSVNVPSYIYINYHLVLLVAILYVQFFLPVISHHIIM